LAVMAIFYWWYPSDIKRFRVEELGDDGTELGSTHRLDGKTRES
jgi:hypothetical protein